MLRAQMGLAIQYFFRIGRLVPSLNSSFIILIPKIANAIFIDQYCSIVLANFLYKVITKLLVDCLAMISSCIASDNQFGIIKGRNMEDCIVMASNFVIFMDNKCFGSNVALKIDIRKYCDSMSWDFILEVLHCFRFSDCFCVCVKNIIEYAHISILFKGYSGWLFLQF